MAFYNLMENVDPSKVYRFTIQSQSYGPVPFQNICFIKKRKINYLKDQNNVKTKTTEVLVDEIVIAE